MVSEMNRRHCNRFAREARHSEAGLALVSALLMLVIITLLGVSLFLGVGLQQKAAGNSMDKSRALEVVQSVTTAAERWLDVNSQKLGPVGCSSTVGTFRLCISPPNDPADPSSWASAGATTVDLQQVRVDASGAMNTYAAQPAVWISYLGRATMGSGNLYEIDAQAYGGNPNTVAVIQAVYYVGLNANNSTPAQNLGQ